MEGLCGCFLVASENWVAGFCFMLEWIFTAGEI